MSFQRKRAYATLIAEILILVSFILFISDYPRDASPSNLALTTLVWIGVGAAAIVCILILFHILFSIGIAASIGINGEKKPDREIEAAMIDDEMEKSIGLKATRIGAWVMVGGIMVSLASFAISASVNLLVYALFHTLYGGAIASTLAYLSYYRRMEIDGQAGN